ncbi:glutamate synthase large subunit [Clostridium felsineum]|uniref:Ferredoxin-dependent glutamate synthase 1 n=1 Tax=Clostridium felsineum TaxID=36839 RepID=A0A1S8L007_9CLOT|nr:glutamate synthase large subunit [Clostridium felsineum]URZ06391.1 Ferredoxin-dependent glutamate synthase 1 [Clostridium felsineum]URZ11426.1 Ferredoxin-dependent glutamate synthase 1 [Clostridium felsineum]
MTRKVGYPEKQGLYDPAFEKDNCGIGFIASIKGEKSHDIVKKGIEILVNLTHRGAVGADTKTGDGAGIMLQIPHEFFKINCDNLGIELPEDGKYAVGMVFLPKETALSYQCEGIFERAVEEQGQKVLGWRVVPRDNRSIGETAKGSEPVIKQIFIGSTAENQIDFERKLYIIRKRAESEVKRLVERGSEYFYICSLSSRTIVYKGLLLADQIKSFYMDLNDINFKSAIALVHQRYSTNTFPTWDLAQPFRFLAHNGEINTIRGNRNWMNAREGVLKSEVFENNISDLFPVVNPKGSDSTSLDNTFELLVADGRPLSEALMMLIPEAWENNEDMEKWKRAFYEYQGTLIEPWDGPAAVAFTDGVQVGAVLDRNGLRPARYFITKNNIAVLASEAGVLKFEPEEIAYKGRLQPGKMFLIDTKEGRIIDDEEVKKSICLNKDYEKIVKENKFTLDDFEGVALDETINDEVLKEKQQAFLYTLEDLKVILAPMAKDAKEPIGSMGNDAPLAVLSNKSQLLFAYFKQLFAQVTNPPIDPIREEMVTSLVNYIGSQGNILNKNAENVPFIEIDSPILTDIQMEKVKNLRNKDFKTTTIPITFKYDTGIDGFKEALDKICERASKRIKEGFNIIVLSDKHIDSYEAAIPSLLALSAVQHHLIKEKTRTKVSIIVETGEARETMHFALLVGYGATAVNPYIAFDSIKQLIKEKDIEVCSVDKAIDNYIYAINHGILKILSKMGISTIRSYHGAEIFEAVGLNSKLVNKYFEGTPSRIEGIGLEEVAKETLNRYKNAFNKIRKPVSVLSSGGQYAWRKNGEYHLFNPDTIYRLQASARTGNYKIFKEYSDIINNQDKNLCTIRGLFKFKNLKPIPLDEVEPVSEILKRFSSGAMSFGSISKEAHETIAIAMNRIGGKSNSGEGGEDNERYKADANGDLRRSAIKQIASARFGVTAEYLVNADELQIKMAQGAKPGEGGQLPGRKVDVNIAKVRHSTPGIDLISPPPHHDIYSIEDLAQLIFDLKCVNPSSRISVKLVSEVGVGTVAAGVAKAHADSILISGHDGGTGASPVSSIKHAGIPWELGLSEAQQVLLLNNLRSRVVLQTDGQLKTGRDVVIAALLGAEEFVFASTILVSLGCVMLRNCHLNTCEMGIATQDPELRKRFKGKPEYVINFLTFIAQEVREYMAQLGFRTINEMVGRVDKIEEKDAVSHWKAKGIDLSKILYKPDMPKRIKPYCTVAQEHGLDKIMDYKLIQISKDALNEGKKVVANFEIKNVDRSVGAMLSGKVAKLYGEKGLSEDTICLNFYGSAGQSFGAFGMKGITLMLEGEANDYVGKSLSGAKIAIKTPKKASYKQDENVIAGNTVLYGATSGKLFINGMVGERFAVRNSGAYAVAEGTGDHCCEYMTGGTIVVIGETGRNFGAGMSGGTAFVLDTKGDFEEKCKGEMLEITNDYDAYDEKVLYGLIKEHYEYTDSVKAKAILDNWGEYKKKFKKVIPTAYKLIIEKAKQKSAEVNM